MGGVHDTGLPSDDTQPAEAVGLLWNWRRGDPLPALAPPGDNWRVTLSTAEEPLLAAPLTRDFATSLQSRQRRFGRGHHLYVGYLGPVAGQPVACGWVAHGRAGFGVPGIAFETPPGQVYLFDFTTRESWRGRGCYPALLQAIITTDPAHDFWIIHHISNDASQRGIARAGFRQACAVYATAAGPVALRPAGATSDRERIAAGAALLGLPLLPAAE